jgi:hypothetical protein
MGEYSENDMSVENCCLDGDMCVNSYSMVKAQPILLYGGIYQVCQALEGSRLLFGSNYRIMRYTTSLGFITLIFATSFQKQFGFPLPVCQEAE